MWHNGILVADSGSVIAKPGMTTAEVLSKNLPVSKPAGQAGAGHERIDIGPVNVAGNAVYLDLTFESDHLKLVGVTLSPETQKRVVEAERSARPLRDFYEQWVLKEAGQPSPAKFPWGEVGAMCDQWTQECSIFFRYH